MDEIKFGKSNYLVIEDVSKVDQEDMVFKLIEPIDLTEFSGTWLQGDCGDQNKHKNHYSFPYFDKISELEKYFSEEFICYLAIETIRNSRRNNGNKALSTPVDGAGSIDKLVSKGMNVDEMIARLTEIKNGEVEAE